VGLYKAGATWIASSGASGAFHDCSAVSMHFSTLFQICFSQARANQLSGKRLDLVKIPGCKRDLSGKLWWSWRFEGTGDTIIPNVH
jgi:hypothetical protein